MIQPTHRGCSSLRTQAKKSPSRWMRSCTARLRIRCGTPKPSTFLLHNSLPPFDVERGRRPAVGRCVSRCGGRSNAG